MERQEDEPGLVVVAAQTVELVVDDDRVNSLSQPSQNMGRARLAKPNRFEPIRQIAAFD